MPSANWTMSRTAAPMQLPRSVASRGAAGGTRVSCWVGVVMSCLPVGNQGGGDQGEYADGQGDGEADPEGVGQRGRGMRRGGGEPAGLADPAVETGQPGGRGLLQDHGQQRRTARPG